jgi:hypothetical protein
MSGNLLFNADRSDITTLESRITAELDAVALVRTRPELAKIAAHDPFRSAILFLARAPTAARRREFLRLEFELPRPELRGKTVFFAHPATLRGKSTPFDFERALGVQGTARSAGGSWANFLHVCPQEDQRAGQEAKSALSGIQGGADSSLEFTHGQHADSTLTLPRF